MKNINYSETVKNSRFLLKNYILKANLKSLVLGISGGIDSALVAAIAKPVCDELEIPLIGRFISIETNKPDERERAINIAKCFCTEFKEVDLTEQFIVLKSFDEDSTDRDIAYKIRMGNIKARMRMMYIYNIASKTGGLVLSTDNYTEYLEGFSTLHGDVGDYGMVQYLWKTEIYEMSEYLSTIGTDEENDALSKCIECNATDGLGITSTDLDQLLPDWKERHSNTRSGYKEVDSILESFLETTERYNKVSNLIDKQKLISILEILNKSNVIQRFIKTDFKRTNPINIKREDFVVSGKL